MNINDFNSLIQQDSYVRKQRPKQNFDIPSIKPVKLPSLNEDVFEKTAQPGKKEEIEFCHFCVKTKTPQKIKAMHNNLNKGVVYKKIVNQTTGKPEKVPLVVDIAESHDGISTSYYFLEPDTKEEIGFVVIDDWRKKFFDITNSYELENTRLLDDFPKQHIEGDRISIDYLQNNDESKYCGIGKLADQIAVEYCLQEGIEPNILSIAETNSHAAHYKRGRKFLPVDKFDKDIDYYEFVKTYGTNDPNKIIEKRIACTPKGQKVDTSDLYGLYMYMPQDIVQKYLEQIKTKPVLHKNV